MRGALLVVGLGVALGSALLTLTWSFEAEAQAPRGPVLPRLAGKLLTGEGEASTDVLRKRNGLVLLFSSTDAHAEDLAKLVAQIERDAANKNLGMLGIARAADPTATRGLVDRVGFKFPVIHDASSQLERALGTTAGRAALLVVDPDGYVVTSLQTDAAQFDAGLTNRVIREALHLPLSNGAPRLGLNPVAPDFSVQSLEGEKLSLASLKGDVVLVMFFLHTCPHCHDMLKFAKQLRAQLKRDDFHVVPISLLERPGAVEKMVEELGVDYPVYIDPNGAAQKAYPPTLGVPHMFLLDREHRILSTHEGSEPRIQALLVMGIRRALGMQAPILLDRNGYSGEEACRVCHTAEHETWSLTTHAYAFETLVEHGADRNDECLACHTVGFKQAGGFDPAVRQPFLEGVQCENCHGRGGPHLSPDFNKNGYEAACLTCHNETHSLRFSFAERLPLVSHAANAQLAASLSLEERRALLEQRDKRERTLFEKADFVGSEKCAQCHTQEHERWKASPHARAFETLEAKQSADNKECQACHTTGFEQKGGFPEGGAAFQGVGCESCHGPGGNHVAQAKPTSGSILRLTEKCDSCVILQICGTCHDDANDPGFEFEVEDKIDAIRHGFRDREPPAASVK